MVACKVSLNENRPSLHSGACRYVAKREVRSARAALDASRVADSLIVGRDCNSALDEAALFKALHTCAYRATRRTRRERTKPDERDAWTKRWKLIRDHIVTENLGLVGSMLTRFGSQGLDWEEQRSVATMALLKATDGFDPWLGFRFSTYACNAIRRSLILAARAGTRRRMRSSPALSGELHDHPARVDAEPELYVDRINRVLDKNAGELTEREASVVAWRFPMDGSPGLTLGEIGRAIGLSKERVRQIQRKALAKLRRVLETDPLLQ